MELAADKGPIGTLAAGRGPVGERAKLLRDVKGDAGKSDSKLARVETGGLGVVWFTGWALSRRNGGKLSSPGSVSPELLRFMELST